MGAEVLLSNFNFTVEIELSGLGGDEGLSLGARGAFSEVSGLEITLEPVTFREGGYNRGARQLVGKTTNAPLVLKRGLSLDPAFWTWVQRCIDGTFPLPYVRARCGSTRPAGPPPRPGYGASRTASSTRSRRRISTPGPGARCRWRNCT